MIRPAAVTFLDDMLKSTEGLRVEEIAVPEGFRGCRLSELAAGSRDFLCVAVRDASGSNSTVAPMTSPPLETTSEPPELTTVPEATPPSLNASMN